MLAFGGRNADRMPVLRQALAKIAPWHWVRPRLVLGAAVPEHRDATALSDLDGEAHAAHGIGDDAALVLVRPDGHIAFRGRADRPDLPHAYCERVFAGPERSKARIEARMA